MAAHRRSVALLAALLLLAASCEARGFIGCMFSPGVCDDPSEWCFDDYAFGRCVPSETTERDVYTYRHPLGHQALRALHREMSRLFSLGYRWSHIYTQCVLQQLLDSFRLNIAWDNAKCDPLSDQDLESALGAIEGDEMPAPQSLAVVKFTPSAANPHPQFADEVYYPPITAPEPINVLDEDGNYRTIVAKKAERIPGIFETNPDVASWRNILGVNLPTVEERAAPSSFSREYNTPEQFRQGYETRDRAGYTEGGPVLQGIPMRVFQ